MKNKLKIIIFLIFVIVVQKFAYNQIKAASKRVYNDSLPQEYKLNTAELREKIYSGIPQKFKTELYEHSCYFFADNVASEIRKFISNGNIYSDWVELENYLNEILKKVIPKELENDSTIHVYVVEDGDYNAFMAPSGHVFVNIGVFSEIYNEATLAGVFAHEIAHYYLKHSIQEFIDEKSGKFIGKIFNEKVMNSYSRKFEYEADSLSIKWLNNSGYNINGLLFSFQTMERLENNYLGQLGRKKKLDATTHPLAKDRLNAFLEQMKKLKNQEGKNFLVDEDKFFKFREEAKPEILRYLFEEYEYSDCIEQAFKFHLFDPDNLVFINYMMESIRRKCYLDSRVWTKMFITDRYFETYESNGAELKREMTDHLFVKFNFDILHMDVRIASQIKAKFYWKDSPKFTTYDEAFEFFYRLSRALNDHECILSKALRITDNKEERNKLITEYLSFDDIEYRSYAESLQNETIVKNLPKKTMLVMSTLEAYVKIKDEEVEIRNHVSDTVNELILILDSVVKEFSGRTGLFLPYLNECSINEYKKIKKLERFSMIMTLAQGEKTELYILDPLFWETFVKYGVNEIEFINGIFTDNQSSENNLLAFRNIMDSDFNNIFQRTKNTKYLDLFISSVRIINGKVMKVRYYSGSRTLKFKNTGYNEIINEIKSNIYLKEKRAEELDYRYSKNL